MTKGAAGADTGARSHLWLQGLVCGAVVTLATPTALLAGLLLAPALIAKLTERREGRPLTRVLSLFGVAASAAPLTHLWFGGHSLTLAVAIATDPATLGLSYASAGFGWLLSEVLPLCLRVAMETSAAARMARLRSARARLREAWRLPDDETVA